MTDEQFERIRLYLQPVVHGRRPDRTPGGKAATFRRKIQKPSDAAQRRYLDYTQANPEVKILAENDIFRHYLSVFLHFIRILYTETGCRNLVGFIQSNPVTAFFCAGTIWYGFPYFSAALGALVTAILEAFI